MNSLNPPRGRPCTICAEESLYREAARLRDEGLNFIQIAHQMGRHRQGVRRHLANGHTQEKWDDGALPLPKEAVAPIVAPTVVIPKTPSPEMPDTAGMSEKDAAVAHKRYLEAKVRWAEQQGADLKAIAVLSAQLSNASRLVGKLSGSFEVTQSQIVRSQPWKQLMMTVGAVLERFPDAMVAVTAALEELDNQGKL